MSSFTLSTRKEALGRIDRMAADIPHLGNRSLFQEWVVERSSQVKPGTLAAQAHAVRCFLQGLGEIGVKDVGKKEWNRHFATTTRRRVWRNKNREGKETETTGQSELGQSTLMQHRIFLRLFFNFVYEGELPSWFKLVEIKRPARQKLDPEEIIRREDLAKLLALYAGARERAIFAVLHDTGFRAQEFCNLNGGSVLKDDYGFRLKLPDVDGNKTGPRTVRIVESVPYLTAWLNLHPFKGDPKAPLFVSMSRRAPMARMTNNALWLFVNRAGKAAGLRIDLHCHLFRHSAASERAREGWNEVMLRQHFGWNDGSEMPTLYVTLAAQDIDQMILKAKGVVTEVARHEPGLRPLVCRYCKGENPITALFCGHCHQIVNPDAEREVEKIKEDEMRERLAVMVAGAMKEQIAAEVQAALRLPKPGRPAQPRRSGR